VALRRLARQGQACERRPPPHSHCGHSPHTSGMQARVVTQWQSHSFDTAKALGDLSVWSY